MNIHGFYLYCKFCTRALVYTAVVFVLWEYDTPYTRKAAAVFDFVAEYRVASSMHDSYHDVVSHVSSYSSIQLVQEYLLALHGVRALMLFWFAGAGTFRLKFGEASE